MHDSQNYELYIDGMPLPRNVTVDATRMGYAQDAKSADGGRTVASRGGPRGPFEVHLHQPLGADNSLSELFKKSKPVNLRVVHQEPPEEGDKGARKEIVEYVYQGLVSFEMTIHHDQGSKTLKLWSLTLPAENFLKKDGKKPSG